MIFLSGFLNSVQPFKFQLIQLFRRIWTKLKKGSIYPLWKNIFFLIKLLIFSYKIVQQLIVKIFGISGLTALFWQFCFV